MACGLATLVPRAKWSTVSLVGDVRVDRNYSNTYVKIGSGSKRNYCCVHELNNRWTACVVW